MKKIKIYSCIILVCFVLIACNENGITKSPDTGFIAGPDTLIMHSVSVGNDSTILYLPDDLDATLWAESPMLYNPTNMDVDYKGRIWVTEAVNYRSFNNKAEHRLNHPQGDRVMILEDTNDDGIADTSIVFVQDTDLVAPLGIAVIGDKVIVSCAPNLIVYTDTDGDDKADKKEVILTGFGGFDHDHSLHALVAGPDGNYYFNTGNAGPHLVTDKAGWHLRSGSLYTGGTPYNLKNEGNMKSDDGRVWVGGLALRMKKDGTGLKVMAHNFRNSYEYTVDSYGNMWQNDNDDQVMACRTSFLMEGANAGYFSKDGTRSWQADRRINQDMFSAHWHQDDPGVMPVSDNAGAGSPTGMAINESDALGKKYMGMVLSAEAGRNVIYAYWPSTDGAGYSMKRQNLISTLPRDNVNYQWNNDIENRKMWFRPSDICFGTDGALYIADWYDPIVGGHAMHDSVGYGRIFRIFPRGKKLMNPIIDIHSDEGIATAWCSPAINVRNWGFEKGSGNKTIISKLLNSIEPYKRARAIYSLILSEPNQYENFIHDKNENIRIAVLRAVRQTSIDGIPILELLASDPSLAVRREVAIACRDIGFEQSKNIIQKLINNYPASDKWFDAAFGIACDGKEVEVFNELLKDSIATPEWNGALLAQVFTLHPKECIQGIQKQLLRKNISTDVKRKMINAIAFINDTTAVNAMFSLVQSKDSTISDLAFYWLNFRKSNDWKNLYDWKKFNQNQLPASFNRMITLQEKLLSTASESEKIKIATRMAKDGEGGKLLLTLIALEQIKGKIKDTVSTILVNNPDIEVRSMASDLFWRKTNKKSFQYSIELITKMQPDINNGKQKFETNCTSCHRKDNIGKDIGPDLSAIKQKLDARSLVDAILNPSANIAFGFELSSLKTRDNKSYFGFIVSEGETVSIKDITGNIHPLNKEDILSKKSMPNSLMPTPQQIGLSDRDVADIVGYLESSH
ncbi:MAG: PVC-type heme-binding CxxCH protein [Saprospiraceae bacterium]